MVALDPGTAPARETYGLLIGGVAPRPIALVATLSAQGERNLAPFSYFNAFGIHPPMVAFSPTRRGKGGSFKDTYLNIVETGECTIQAVTRDIAEQVSLTSAEFPHGVDEFVKSGLTPVPSERVRPPRVGESPFQMECRLQQMIPLGDQPGSGNLALCEVLLFHVSAALWRDGKFDTAHAGLVGRSGGDFYTHAAGSALFELPRPAGSSMGYDGLPEWVRHSEVLSAGNLALLAAVEKPPSVEEAVAWAQQLPRPGAGAVLTRIYAKLRHGGDPLALAGLALGLCEKGRARLRHFETAARRAIECGDTATAWKLLLFAGQRFEK